MLYVCARSGTKGYPPVWSLKEFFDVGSKLALPVVLAWGGWHLQQGLTSSQLLNQREQSDTTIRAELFKALSDKAFRNADGKLPTEQRAVYAELLALNFHQHIHLKPLMLDVDEHLRSERKGQARDELLSAAKRIRDRQVQLLANRLVSDESGHDDSAQVQPVKVKLGTVNYISVRETGNLAVGQSECEAGVGGVDVCRNAPVLFQLPYSEERASLREQQQRRKATGLLAVAVDTLDFERQVFKVSVGHSDGGGTPSKPPREERVDDSVSTETAPKCVDPRPDDDSTPSPHASLAETFFITPYDFPMTDNTLMKSGLRYAVFVDLVCKKQKTLRLGVLWFPPDFLPAFERPISNQEFLNRLRLTPGRG